MKKDRLARIDESLYKLLKRKKEKESIPSLREASKVLARDYMELTIFDKMKKRNKKMEEALF